MSSNAPRRLTLLATLLVAPFAGRALPLPDAESVALLPPAEIEQRLPESHPALYFAYANRLWSDNQRDEAVMWLYVAQLRYRFHLAAHPELGPSGDPALFGTLLATIGRPINQFAGRDLANWRSQIDRALQWDRDQPNTFTSRESFLRAWQHTREGLEQLRAQLRPEIKETARSSAAPSALAAATVAKRPMPADWPPLVTSTTVAALCGTYAGGVSSPFVRTFFAGNRRAVMKANAFEIRAIDERHLSARALFWDKLLTERVIDLREVDGGLAFTETTVDNTEGWEPVIITRQILRQNLAGELVIECERYAVAATIAAMAGGPNSVEWNRAPRETAAQKEAKPPQTALRRMAMPSHWPALQPQTNLTDLEGVYANGVNSLLKAVFFPSSKQNLRAATRFDLTADDDRHLRVRAWRDQKLLRERLIDILAVDDGIAFTLVDEPSPTEPTRRKVTRRHTLRRNVAGDLVAECQTTREGPSGIEAERKVTTRWYREARWPADADPPPTTAGTSPKP